MTAEQAAKSLDETFRKHPWYISVGVGATPDGEAIFVYVKSPRHRELTSLSAGWMGYPVLIRPVGSIRAVQHEQIRAALRD
jgi:hypothetical protein